MLTGAAAQYTAVNDAHYAAKSAQRETMHTARKVPHAPETIHSAGGVIVASGRCDSTLAYFATLIHCAGVSDRRTLSNWTL